MLSKLSSSPQAPFGQAPTAPESLFNGLGVHRLDTLHGDSACMLSKLP